MQQLNAENVPKELIEKGQNRVIEASLTLIRERAKLKVHCLSDENCFLIQLSSLMAWDDVFRYFEIAVLDRDQIEVFLIFFQ